MFTPLPTSMDPGVASKTCGSLIISPALSPILSKVVKRAAVRHLRISESFCQHLVGPESTRTWSSRCEPHRFSGSHLQLMEEESPGSTYVGLLLTDISRHKNQYDKTRDLATYSMIVLQNKHNGSSWLLYDWQFHQQQVIGVFLLWTEVSFGCNSPKIVYWEVILSLSSLPSSWLLSGTVCPGSTRPAQANSSHSSLCTPSSNIMPYLSLCSVQSQWIMLPL